MRRVVLVFVGRFYYFCIIIALIFADMTVLDFYVRFKRML